MKKSAFFFIIAMMSVFMASNSSGQEEGRAFFDFGVFAFEDGDYPNAAENFKNALERNPGNPVYHHYLGKTYVKTEQFQEALFHLSRAMDLDSDLSGLTYDLAYLYLKTGRYKEAGEMFSTITQEDPSHVMALYYTGICLFSEQHHAQALNYFLEASEKSPTIKVNGAYYAGICYQKTGQIQKSIEMFEYVKANAASEPLRENAVKWLNAIDKEKKTQKPFSIYLKLGAQYDSNVRLEPLDRDIYADKDDAALIGHLLGNYHIVNRRDLILGVGYSHYLALYQDLSEFDLSVSSGNLFARYRLPPFTLGFSYIPSYFWVDSDSYLRQHQVQPEIFYEFSDRLLSRLSYSYLDKEYFDEKDRDGDGHDTFLDLYYSLFKNKLRLFGRIGYALNDASHSDYDYGEIKTKLGCTFRIPWDLALTVTGKYEARFYDHKDTLYQETREDDRYIGALSILCPVYSEWLNALAEYQYTQNRSNIDDYEYERHVATLSLVISY